MGQKVRIFASKKWQLSLTLGPALPHDPVQKPGDRITKFEKPVARIGPSLRIIWPDQAVQGDGLGAEGGAQP